MIDYQENGYSVNLHPYVDPVDNISNLLSDQPFYTNTISLGASGDLYNIYASFQNQASPMPLILIRNRVFCLTSVTNLSKV